MLVNYLQNLQVGMTKQQYFDMCTELGTEPVEAEIPVEEDDFPLEMQQAWLIYKVLRDDWDYMNGNYIGKNLNGIFDLFKVYDLDIADYKFYLELLHLIDKVRSDQIRLQTQQKPTT